MQQWHPLYLQLKRTNMNNITQKLTDDASSVEGVLAKLREELGKHRSQIPDVETATAEEILKDIHKAIYGNGDPAEGMVYRSAEQHVLILEMAAQHLRCRAQVVEHLNEYQTTKLRREVGIIGMSRQYPKVAAVIVAVLFLGITSLWSLLQERRQATQVEAIAVKVVQHYLPLLSENSSSNLTSRVNHAKRNLPVN